MEHHLLPSPYLDVVQPQAQRNDELDSTQNLVTKVICYTISKRTGVPRKRRITYDEENLVLLGGDDFDE